MGNKNYRRARQSDFALQIDQYDFGTKKISMIDFLNKAKHQFSENLPFVIYKKPNEDKVIGYFQKNNLLFETADFSEKGFVFSSFDGSKNSLIPESESDRVVADFEIETVENPVNSDYLVGDTSSKNNFENLVKLGIDSIVAGAFKKVVLSREEIIILPEFDAVETFRKVIQNYPSAFCYCWFHPKVGLWIGASPEQLLKIDSQKMSTVSLAGTQKADGNDNVEWGDKEKTEQQIVTNSIIQDVENELTEYKISNPYSYKAGNLVHLKTDIEGVLKPNFKLNLILEKLHPTPAVCGFPKKSARDFILKNEGYNRRFYSGFFGEINLDNYSKTVLHVNLRCMQIENKTAHLYIGCGITQDSVPEMEWIETVNKAVTMKKIIL